MKCIFCYFVSGKNKVHTIGYPFIFLNKTKHTISFLSMDIPAHEEGHIIIIPKKHFKNMEDVPKNILHDLIEHISLASKVIRKYHKGCNILLNNGKYAGQHEMHVHFHVIPRDKGDSITIDSWEPQKLTSVTFKRISNKFKKQFLEIKKSYR